MVIDIPGRILRWFGKLTLRGTKKLALFSLGSLFLSLGILGVLLPVVPAIPFMLLAFICYIRVSNTIFELLMRSRIGKVLRKEIPLKVKIISVAMLWLTIFLPPIILVDYIPLRIVSALMGIGFSAYIISIKSVAG